MSTATSPSASDRGSGPTPFVILGDATSARIERFQAALAKQGHAPARVVGYDDLLAGQVTLPDAVAPGAIVRIESPDRNFAVERGILALGATQEDAAGNFARATPDEVAALPDRPGEIRFPRQWYLGYRALLSEIARQLRDCPPHREMSDPAEIATMFDKPACHALLARDGIAVPRALGPIGSYEELRARMREAGLSRVFVKLAHGSSASGVVAYQVGRDREQAMTTVEVVREADRLRLFNNLRVRVYRDHREIAALFDALCRHRVHVEQWIPKAGHDGRTFDLRVVVIGGAARHVVVRLSRHPMTNLHLSAGHTSGRAPLDALAERLDPAAWAAARRTCERAMTLFPCSLYAGIDLLIAADYRRHAIAEINAFGDLLYNVWHEGRDTYATEILAALTTDQVPAPVPPAAELRAEAVAGDGERRDGPIGLGTSPSPRSE